MFLLLLLQILSTFGDLALQLGDSFEKYLETVKRMLSQAMHLSVMQAQNSQDDDFLDYNNELRIGILEAYSGIFQGLGSGKGKLMQLLLVCGSRCCLHTVYMALAVLYCNESFNPSFYTSFHCHCS